ncbi:MAG: hypothetical protein ACRD51_16130 [Candidatus Acidiferrum sp.]
MYSGISALTSTFESSEHRFHHYSCGCELDEGFEFGELIEQHRTDSRRAKNAQFPFADLLRFVIDRKERLDLFFGKLEAE